jgi:hypothetical protein
MLAGSSAEILDVSCSGATGPIRKAYLAVPGRLICCRETPFCRTSRSFRSGAFEKLRSAGKAKSVGPEPSRKEGRLYIGQEAHSIHRNLRRSLRFGLGRSFSRQLGLNAHTAPLRITHNPVATSSSLPRSDYSWKVEIP